MDLERVKAQYNQSNIWLSIEASCRADSRVCKCFRPQRAKDVEGGALNAKKELEYISSNYCYVRCNPLIHSPPKKLKRDR